MKLAEIASRINAHLKRFEKDPVINATDERGLRDYHWATAYSSGRTVCVRYISYQGRTCLTKTQAGIYLEWLDAGNVGRHWEALKAAKEKTI